MKLRSLTRIALAIGIMGLILGMTASAASADTTFIGMTVEQALKTDFFTFFHLEKSGERGGKIEFKPSGERFHDLVTVSVGLGDKSHIGSMELIMKRSFVDDKSNGAYARDIAGSFLRGALTASELKTNAALIEWISCLQGYNVLTAQDIKTPGSKQPDTYLVYLGNKQKAASGKLTMTSSSELLTLQVK